MSIAEFLIIAHRAPLHWRALGQQPAAVYELVSPQGKDVFVACELRFARHQEKLGVSRTRHLDESW